MKFRRSFPSAKKSPPPPLSLIPFSGRSSSLISYPFFGLFLNKSSIEAAHFAIIRNDKPIRFSLHHSFFPFHCKVHSRDFVVRSPEAEPSLYRFLSISSKTFSQNVVRSQDCAFFFMLRNWNWDVGERKTTNKRLKNRRVWLEEKIRKKWKKTTTKDFCKRTIFFLDFFSSVKILPTKALGRKICRFRRVELNFHARQEKVNNREERKRRGVGAEKKLPSWWAPTVSGEEHEKKRPLWKLTFCGAVLFYFHWNGYRFYIIKLESWKR